MVRQGDHVEDTTLNCGRIITVDAPATGTWLVRMAPAGRFWLSVHAKSGLSLSAAEFVERDDFASDRLVRIQGEPIAGRPATLRVHVSSAIGNPTFQLISLDAQPLQAIDLQSTDGREFSGAVTLPTEPFRVVVNGRDPSGSQVQRIWPGLFHGEAVEVVPPERKAIGLAADHRGRFQQD